MDSCANQEVLRVQAPPQCLEIGIFAVLLFFLRWVFVENTVKMMIW